MNPEYKKDNCYDINAQIEDGTLKKVSLDSSVLKFENSKKEIFYYKYISNKFLEILAEKIANLYEIPCVHVELAKYGNMIGVISKDFKEPGYKYFSGDDISREYINSLTKDEILELYGVAKAEDIPVNNLEFIWHAIEYHLKNRENASENTEDLMQELVYRFCADLIIMQSDRNLGNYYFKDDGEYLELAPSFDNEYCFSSNRPFMMSSTPEDYKSYINDIIATFAKITDKDMLLSFYQMTTILTSEKLSELIDEIAGVYGEDTFTRAMSLWYLNNANENGPITYEAIKKQMCLMFAKNKKDIMNAFKEQHLEDYGGPGL